MVTSERMRPVVAFVGGCALCAAFVQLFQPKTEFVFDAVYYFSSFAGLLFVLMRMGAKVDERAWTKQTLVVLAVLIVLFFVNRVVFFEAGGVR